MGDRSGNECGLDRSGWITCRLSGAVGQVVVWAEDTNSPDADLLEEKALEKLRLLRET